MHELIGRGGMAEVYRANLLGPSGFSKVVALKKIHPFYANDRHFQELFLNEARLLAKLSHPNIVQVLQVGFDDDSPYLILEWIEGRTLKQILENTLLGKRLLPEPVIRSIMKGILSALVAAHEFEDPETGRTAPIIHRDLSPHNVMIDKNGMVKVLDFGVAKILGGKGDFTKSEAFKGKFPYMSPEMVLGEQVSERSDLFSLGIICFEMLTGSRLFRGNSDFECLELIKKGSIPEISSLRPSVSEALAGFTMKLLRKNPMERMPSAKVALKELAAIKRPKYASPAKMARLATINGFRQSYPLLG
ncbi:MAG: serine/threonine protein kinase, partial [Deltaproteobacteria bacterium]|nr:serine/threonine protein kinase [Deltaproteobacteria bacterium]